MATNDVHFCSAICLSLKFRFNERKNPERFQKTLSRMMQAEPLEYKAITASPETA